ISREIVLEALDRRAENKGGILDHCLDRFVDFSFDGSVLGLEINEWNCHPASLPWVSDAARGLRPDRPRNREAAYSSAVCPTLISFSPQFASRRPEIQPGSVAPGGSALRRAHPECL